MKLQYLKDAVRYENQNYALIDNSRPFGLFGGGDTQEISYQYLLTEADRFAEFYAGQGKGRYVDLKVEGWRTIARLLGCIMANRIVSIEAGEKAELVDPNHELIRHLVEQDKPGLLLFTSGSTGQPKVALHDFEAFLSKFEHPRAQHRVMLLFMALDHIGGINTLFHSLYNAGTLVIPKSRDPETVCQAITRFGVQVLPTTPTFLNLMLYSQAHKASAMTKLDTITYGTEPMPETTLERLRAELPHVKLHQTYGSTETGILRSKSRDSESLWMKLGGEGFETRVRDGMLEVKARGSMLGYLNAPSPYTPDGWYRTGDLVETNGDYYRILGRKSEIINVGGEKVHPLEIESLLEALPGVIAAVAKAEQHPMTGQIVSAMVELDTDENVAQFNHRMREALKPKVPSYKIPQKVIISQRPLVNDRGKKVRHV